MGKIFQVYLITCISSGKRYVGITSGSLKRRWIEHISYAHRSHRIGALQSAILKYGRDSFTIEPLCSSKSWEDLCAIEPILIKQWATLAPNGYNLDIGGTGRSKGFKPSAESVERSASKHRGQPCHPNTRFRSSETHKGKPKSEEHRKKIAAALRGNHRSSETKAKMSAYWDVRRKAGEFRTPKPYAHRKSAI